MNENNFENIDFKLKNLKFDYSLDTLKKMIKIYKSFEVLAVTNLSKNDISNIKIKKVLNKKYDYDEEIINKIKERYFLLFEPFSFLFTNNVKFNIFFYYLYWNAEEEKAKYLHDVLNGELTNLNVFEKEKVLKEIEKIKSNVEFYSYLQFFLKQVLINSSLNKEDLNSIMRQYKSKLGFHFEKRTKIIHRLDEKIKKLERTIREIKLYELKKYKELIKKQPKYKRYYLYSIKQAEKRIEKLKNKKENLEFLFKFNNYLYFNNGHNIFKRYCKLFLGKELTEMILNDFENMDIELTSDNGYKSLIYLQTLLKVKEKYQEKYKKFGNKVRFYAPLLSIRIKNTIEYEILDLDNPLEFYPSYYIKNYSNINDNFKIFKILAKALQVNIIFLK